MEVKEAVRVARLKQWSAIFEDQSRSGMTASIYCKAKGITRSTYYYWLHECREAILKAQSTSFVELIPEQYSEGVACRAEAHETAKLNIKYGQVMVEVDAATSPELLSMVLQVLKNVQ